MPNPFPPSESQTTCPLQLVHSDLHGLSLCAPTLDFATGFVLHRRLHSISCCFPIRAKSDTFEAFKAFKSYAENHLNAKIKALRDDKGGEYMSSAFLRFTTDAGIVPTAHGAK